MIFEREYPETQFFTPPVEEAIDYAFINERHFEAPLGEIARLEWEASFLGKQEIEREGWKHLDNADRDSGPSSPTEGFVGDILVLPLGWYFFLLT